LKPSDLAGQKSLISKDGKVGVAISSEGDIQNVFNNGGPKGAASDAMFTAIKAGGRTLDAFDGFLPDYYAQFGFVETGRIKFNREFAPDQWDFGKYGEPDVVFMHWKGFPDNVKVIKDRVSTREGWIGRGKTDKIFDNFDTAKAESRRVASPGSSGEKSGQGVRGEQLAADTGSGQGVRRDLASSKPPTEARAVEKMFNDADAELSALSKPSLKKIRQEVARANLDVSAEIKNRLLKEGGEDGRQAVIRHDLIRGSSAKSERIFTEAAKDIYKDLTKVEETLLNRIIQSRRTIVVDETHPGIKHPRNLGGLEHQSYLNALDRTTRTKLNERADKYFATMQAQLSDLHKHGLISDESFKTLSESGDYSPRFFIQHLDPDNTFTFGGKRISVPDSGIKKLDEGSTKSLENNSRMMLQAVVARTQRRIARNEANKALIDLAETDPENGIVRKATSGKPTKAEEETIRGVKDGKTIDLAMPRELAEQWVESDPAIDSQLANIVGWLSGTKILKPMATGLNPEFALTNMPRDIAHVWLTTHEYSPHLPIAIPEFVADFKATAKDAILRRGSYADYINEGGGMSFLTHQGRVTSKTRGWAAEFQRVLGYMGETSEVWTRLALRNRALTNGKPPHEATWIARNYLDFAQGGWAIKAIDTAIPYLNATVQATRTVGRSARERPGEFTWKVAQMGLLGSGLYLANRFINPEAWDAVPDREKVSNFIITTPLSFTDEEGNKRWLYFKVAKDQPQRLFGSIFEGLTAKAVGDPVDGDQITQAVEDFIPIMPDTTLPPTIEAMVGYYANKDFWRNEDIWRGPEITPREEYTNYTHPALKALGSLTGLSPERLGFSFQQFFTYGNIYTSLVGAGMAQIFKETGQAERETATMDILREAPFLRRVLRATDPFVPFEKELKTLKLEDQTTRFKITRDLDDLSEKFYRAQKAAKRKDLGTLRTEIKRFVAQQPAELQKGLLERFATFGTVFEIPDRRFWLNLKSMSPEARATMFHTRWMQANTTEKTRLQTQATSIPGLISERFVVQFMKLQRKAGRFQLVPEGPRFRFER